MRTQRVVSLLVVLFVSFVALSSSQVKAFVPYQDVWPTASTTYRVTSSITSRTGWETAVNSAASDWGSSTIFSFSANSGSSNTIEAVDPGHCNWLGLMTPTRNSEGIYRGTFNIKLNVRSACSFTWYTGSGTPPSNQTSLRTVLRHEFGHAAGLWHVASGSSSQLMWPSVDPGVNKTIGTDDINGMDYFYNASSTRRLNAAISYWPAGITIDNKYDNTYGAAVGYKGAAWSQPAACCPYAFNDSLAWSNQTGATSWFPFRGSRITWELTKHNNRGTNQVFIDGTYVWWVNMDDNNNTLWQVQKTWDVGYGDHIIEIRGVGGGVDYTDLDSYIVDVAGQTGNHDNTSSKITYDGPGTWTHSSCCPTARNGTISWSNTTNAFASFTFYGSGVRYVHTKAYNRGKVKVTIDGTYVETLDLYANPNQWQQIKTYSGLGVGWHQIHLAVSGTKNASAADYYVDVDMFEVIP